MREPLKLGAGTTISDAYRIICDMNPCRKIVFSRGVLTLIAADNDIHRTREGYMLYISAAIAEINGKTWAITKGVAQGDYPAAPYNSDLIAIRILKPETKTETDISKEIEEAIRLGRFFEHSLVIAMASGEILASDNPKNIFRIKILKSVQREINKNIAQPLQVDKNAISASTLTPVVLSPTYYKYGLADSLATGITAILAEA